MRVFQRLSYHIRSIDGDGGLVQPIGSFSDETPRSRFHLLLDDSICYIGIIIYLFADVDVTVCHRTQCMRSGE